MPLGKISFIDRLNERGVIDRWGFLSFAFVGSAAIIIAKVWGVQPVLVTAFAAGSMLLYAAIIDLAGSGRVRSDQAGDNCYYLGLIYTLTSLAYAIFLFDPADTATTIVQGFGIALATTIMGLVLRVFFNQSRADLVEVEDGVRLELTEAASRLKSELSQIVIRMNDFGHQTVQSLGELRQATTQDMAVASTSGVDAIRASSAAAKAAIESQAAEMSSWFERIAAATEKVSSGLELYGDRLAHVTTALNDASTSISGISNAADATTATVANLSDKVRDLTSLQDGIQATSAGLTSVAGELERMVRSLDATAARFDESVAERLDQVQGLPAKQLSEATAMVSAIVERAGDELERLKDMHARTADNIASQSATALEVTKRHNDALEGELLKSRDNVSKVHSSLVELTGELVRQVEARAAE